MGVGDGTRRQNPLIDSLDVAEATYDYIKLPVDPDGNGGRTTGDVYTALKSDDEGWVERVVHLICDTRLHFLYPLLAVDLTGPSLEVESPSKGCGIPESIGNASCGEDSLDSTRLILKKRFRHKRRISLDVGSFLQVTTVGHYIILVSWIEDLQGPVTVPCCVQLELASCGEGVRN